MNKTWRAEKHIERARNGKCLADVRWDLEWVMNYADQCIFQMLSFIKHFSHCLQITAESSGLAKGRNRAKESLQGWFNNSILKRFKSASTLFHAPLLWICTRAYLASYFFATGPIWFLTFTFLFISLHFARHTSLKLCLLINHRLLSLRTCLSAVILIRSLLPVM